MDGRRLTRDIACTSAVSALRAIGFAYNPAMSLTLIAAVIALVLGHVAPSLASAVRDYGWYQRWLQWLDARFPTGFWRGRYGIVLALLPPLLLVGLFQAALDKPLLGFAGLLFAIAVLFYSWGPRDLDLDVEAIVDAPDPHRARRLPRSLRTGARATARCAVAGRSGVLAAQRRWFGVLFWFLLLGPVGALRIDSARWPPKAMPPTCRRTRALARRRCARIPRLARRAVDDTGTGAGRRLRYGRHGVEGQRRGEPSALQRGIPRGGGTRQRAHRTGRRSDGLCRPRCRRTRDAGGRRWASCPNCATP